MADETRPLRICDSCGQIDDHPRHVFVADPASRGGVSSAEVLRKALNAAKTDAEKDAVIAASMDNETLTKHMDCCEADGCPDGSCTEVRKGAEDKKGAELVKHLTGGN